MQNSPQPKQTSTQAVLSFLLPSKIEAAWYLLVSLAFVVAIKRSLVVSFLFNGSQVSTQQSISVSDQTTVFVYHISNGFSFFSSFVIWFTLGSVVYLAFWIFKSLVRNVSKDLSTRRSSSTAQAKDYWQSASLKYLAILATVIAFICYLYIFIRLVTVFLLPQSGGIYQLAQNHIYWWLALVVLLFAGLLYVLNLLMRTLIYVFKSLAGGN